MSDKKPVLKCFSTPGGDVKAWCPFCKKWHIHSNPEQIKSGKIGHYINHCYNDESPFKETGYILKLMSKAELKEISKSIDLYST